MGIGLREEHALRQEFLQDLPQSLRVSARLSLAVSGASGQSRIIERHEAGAMRFRFPNSAGQGANHALEAMSVNIAGGLAGGDSVDIAVESREGASLTLSSTAAERIYRSAGDETRISLALKASGGASLLWLPQESMLHEGAKLRRSLDIAVDHSATCLMGDMLYFGRHAMGEAFTRGLWRESWRIRRDHRLVLADETRLEGDFSDKRAQPGSLHRARVMASLVLVAPDAEERLPALRAAFAQHPQVEAGASAQSAGGLVFARFLAENGMALRAAFLHALHALAPDDARLPRLLT